MPAANHTGVRSSIMSNLRPAAVVLDEEFLPIRAKLLEIAASLDRLDRAEDRAAVSDPRMDQLRTAIETLLETTPDRAEKVQLIFSLAYEDAWFEEYRLVSGR